LIDVLLCKIEAHAGYGDKTDPTENLSHYEYYCVCQTINTLTMLFGLFIGVVEEIEEQLR
jgi:hypothetical protein